MDNRKWEYIDLKEFEYQIRQEEREKEYQRRCNMRKANRIRVYKRRKALIKTLPIRILGLLLILVSIKMISVGNDGTFALVTLPLGLIGIFCPLNSVDV